MKDKVFEAFLNKMQNDYPHMDIRVDSYEVVSVKGESVFCARGFNTLYNTLRLCEALKEELI